MLVVNNINLKELYNYNFNKYVIGDRLIDYLEIYTCDNKVIGYSHYTTDFENCKSNMKFKILTCKKNFEDFKILLDKVN